MIPQIKQRSKSDATRFAMIKEAITIEQVLDQLGLLKNEHQKLNQGGAI